MPGLGSGPFDNTSGTGYYSVGDYKEILTFAKSHHVTVIPEFDMPGHSRAAIRSIHAKSQQSHRSKMMKAEMYTIIDDQDSLKFKSGQHFRGNVMNPCMESTYDFIRKLMKEVKKIHQPIQPLTMFHIGGDEVADKAWDGSKQCKEFMKTHRGICICFYNDKLIKTNGLSHSYQLDHCISVSMVVCFIHISIEHSVSKQRRRSLRRFLLSTHNICFG